MIEGTYRFVKNFFYSYNIKLPEFFFKNFEKINFIDIGASTFDESNKLLKYKFVNLHLFEPDNRVLKSFFGKYENLYLYDVGLWSSKSIKEINLLKNQIASSIYKPNIKILKNYLGSIDQYNVEKKEKVELNKLDSLSKRIKKSDFIKIDAEGADYDILLGAKKSLNYTIGLQVETQSIERYKDSKLNFEIFKFLDQNNFELFIFNKENWPRNLNFNIDTNLQNVWSDVVFFKKISYLIKELKKKKIKKRKFYIKKLIFLMIYYKLHDAAINYIYNIKEENLISNEDYFYFNSVIKKNISSNFIILIKDFIKLILLILLLPFSILSFNKYKNFLLNLFIKNLNNIKRLLQIKLRTKKEVFRNRGI